MGIPDISGHLIPLAKPEVSDRIIAVPPVRDVPNEVAQEFLMTGFSSLAAGGSINNFVLLTDPATSAQFSKRIPDQFRARIDSIVVYCPDMVAAVQPYLFAQLLFNGDPASAWGFIPVFPRAGVASLSFDAGIELAPNTVIQLAGANLDAVNVHFLGIYLLGWTWPKDYIDA